MVVLTVYEVSRLAGSRYNDSTSPQCLRFSFRTRTIGNEPVVSLKPDSSADGLTINYLRAALLRHPSQIFPKARVRGLLMIPIHPDCQSSFRDHEGVPRVSCDFDVYMRTALGL